jgi:hypothetical protein
MKNNIGSTFDSWLREEGLFEKVSGSAAKRRVDRRDLERINAAAELNSQVADVLRYQSLEDPAGIE